MLAIGTSGGRLFRVVMTEALLLGVLAALIGLALGLAGHAYLAIKGLDLAALYGSDVEIAGAVLSGRIHSHLEPAKAALWTVVVIGLVMISALYPALRAVRLRPIEAMRHV